MLMEIMFMELTQLKKTYLAKEEVQYQIQKDNLKENKKSIKVNN